VLLLTAIGLVPDADAGATAGPQTANNKHKETTNNTVFLIIFPPRYGLKSLINPGGCNEFHPHCVSPVNAGVDNVFK
jgi:hypothetical protein